MKKITNKHNVTFYEYKTNKTITGRLVFAKVKGEKNVWSYPTINGQMNVIANSAEEALGKILAQI